MANDSSVKQRADNAIVTVGQDGIGNESDIFQGANTNNPNDENGDNSVADVSQTGNDNRSDIHQANDDVTASVTQDTSGVASNGFPSNDSKITQAARFGDAVVVQKGVGNDSTIYQGTAGRSSRANVSQTNMTGGTDNISSVAQAAVRSNVDIDQNGEGNSSTVVANGANRSSGAPQVSVNQDGIGNASGVTQSADAFVDVDQLGDGNASAILQSVGSDGASAVVLQTSDDNTSVITQSAGSSITLVASKRPPRPTSITQTSAGTRANSTKAAAMVTSKKLGATPSPASKTSASCWRWHVLCQQCVADRSDR